MRMAFPDYFAWLIRHRRRVLAANLALILIAAAAAARVPIDFTLEQFFPSWGPERARYERYKQSFPQEDMQVSVFWRDSRPVGAAVYRDLQRAAALFEEVGLENITWFGSVEGADRHGLDGSSEPRVATLAEPESMDDSYVRDVLDRQRVNDFYRGYLWNFEQNVFAIHSTLSEEDMRSDRRRREVE
ncbi:MAG: hypothetical protein JSU87_17910, partial [Gemmatimonadota bacterium]